VRLYGTVRKRLTRLANRFEARCKPARGRRIYFRISSSSFAGSTTSRHRFPHEEPATESDNEADEGERHRRLSSCALAARHAKRRKNMSHVECPGFTRCPQQVSANQIVFHLLVPTFSEVNGQEEMSGTGEESQIDIARLTDRASIVSAPGLRKRLVNQQDNLRERGGTTFRFARSGGEVVDRYGPSPRIRLVALEDQVILSAIFPRSICAACHEPIKAWRRRHWQPGRGAFTSCKSEASSRR